ALSGEKNQPIAKIARHYKAEGVKWVAVGDSNYGEGSSREHAALSPRLLDGAAVIARSFARIHESNLKKQGLLALTFQNPADYDRIREDDRVSLLGLAGMAPGKPVECLVKHAGGSTVARSSRRVGPSAASAVAIAGPSASGPPTRSPRAPKARARAGKSGFARSVSPQRPSKSVCWSHLIAP